MDNLKNFRRTNYCGDLRLTTRARPSPCAAGSSGSGTWAG